MKRPIALITGASSGIGEEFAIIMANKGYDLVLSNRNTAKLQELKTKLSALSNVTIIGADLSRQGAAQILFDEVIAKDLVPDVLINNAGFGLFNENTKLDPTKIEEMLVLNVAALTIISRLFSEQMVQKSKGHILNIASVAGLSPLPYFSAYSASKAYVISYSQSIRQELQRHNVSVTVLCPGPTATNFFNVAGVKTDNILMNHKSFMSAAEVAHIGIESMFEGKAVVIAGARNYLLGKIMKIVPTSIVARIVERFAL